MTLEYSIKLGKRIMEPHLLWLTACSWVGKFRLYQKWLNSWHVSFQLVIFLGYSKHPGYCVYNEKKLIECAAERNDSETCSTIQQGYFGFLRRTIKHYLKFIKVHLLQKSISRNLQQGIKRKAECQLIMMNHLAIY